MRFTLLLLIIALFMGCLSSKITDPNPKSTPEYSIIYVIHGDANYLYHNGNGNALQADEQVLAEAKQVAETATSGEVFIFHQKPEDKILWLFPKKDRRFLYYRNGQQIVDENYSPQSDSASFKKEAQLYKKFSQLNSDSSNKRLFLYFGHEVPVNSSGVYYYSRADVPFDTDIFAKGVQSFLAEDDSVFDLTVLSTCNNGTPSMIHALNPFSKYVLASPQDLHLSHIDTKLLPKLLQDKDIPAGSIAKRLADDTYQRLTGFLHTAVTLSVYDTEATASYLPEIAKQYNQYVKTLTYDELLDDNSDCAERSFWNISEIQDSVTTWYKPPRFGSKDTVTNSYSGWGCK